MDQTTTVESMLRKWLRDEDTPLEQLDVFEAIKKGQAFTDAETLFRPMSLQEIVAMLMKVVDANSQFLISMAISAIARAEGWQDDEVRMAKETMTAWATADLLRIEVVDEILRERGPLPAVDSNDPPPEEEG